MKKIVIGFIFIALLFTSGCYGPKDANKSEEDWETQTTGAKSIENTEDPIDPSEIAKIKAEKAVELKKEIKQAFDKIYDSEQENFSLEVETSIKLNQVLTLIEDDDPDMADLLEKQKDISANLKSSLTYSGTTQSGVSVIGIKSPPFDNSAFDDSINKIRGEEKEANFLRDLGNDQSERAEIFYGIDICVEGIISPKSTYSIDNLVEMISGTPFEPIASPVNYSSYINSLLDKYSRELDDGNVVNNKQWKLYIFEGISAPSTISLKIDGEEVTLRQ